jgi:hypothetical protein
MAARWVVTVAALALPAGAWAAPAPPAGGVVPGAKLREAILLEVAVPPPFTGDAKGIAARFGARELARYADGKVASEKFTAAVRKAQVALWATSAAAPPPPLAAEVRAVRQGWKVDLTCLRGAYLAPPPGPGEVRFKEAVFRHNKDLARMGHHLTNLLEELDDLAAERDRQPLRWRANYDLMRACLQARYLLLEEHQFALGSMRKELPPRDAAVHSGWRLVPSFETHGDRAGRAMKKAAHEALTRLIKEHPDAPWSEVARRARAAPLGHQWEGAP